jgi:4-hydroxy-4-methyl-2-oxoglutarate aldolase
MINRLPSRATCLPVVARGLSPNSPRKDGPGTIGLPITLGGVMVGPGDLVVADGDGVVIVPLAAAATVAAALAGVAAREAAKDQAVQAGARTPGWLAARLAQPDIRFLD